MAERVVRKFVPGKGVVDVTINDQGQVISGGEGAMPSPFGGLAGGSLDRPDMNLKIDTTGAGQFFGNALELGAGFALPEAAIPARVLIALLAGAGAGALNGEGPTREGAQNAALEGIFGGAGKALPWLGNRAAYLFGGLPYKQASEAADALEKVNQGRGLTSWIANKLGLGKGGLRVPAGAESKLAPVIASGNRALEAAENANPTRVPIWEGISGQIPGAEGKFGVAPITSDFKKASTEIVPAEERARLDRLMGSYLRGQIDDKGATLSMRELGELKRARGREGKRAIEMRKAGDIPTKAQEKSSAVRASLSRGHGNVQEWYDRPLEEMNRRAPQGPIITGEIVEDASKASAPGTGLMRRGEQGLSDRARPSIFSRMRREPRRLPGETAPGMPSIEIGEIPPTIMPSSAMGPPRERGPIGRANDALSNMFIVEAANDATRAPGLLGEPGKIAARGGLGAGIGGGIGGLLFGGPGLAAGSALGGLGGPVLFSPHGASALSHIGGKASEITPQLTRFLEALYGPLITPEGIAGEKGGVDWLTEGMTERDNKKKAKLREPR